MKKTFAKFFCAALAAVVGTAGFASCGGRKNDSFYIGASGPLTGDAAARAIGAVNCVKITPEGLTGYNTDAYGFRRSLLNLLGDVRPEKALVLGTGGASKAVKYVLEQLGIAFDAVSRDGKNGAYTYGDLSEEIVRAHRLIVNATPLGTFPNAEGCPVLPYEALGAGHFLFDLVYNPAVTEFLKRGAAQGAATRNGYDMLVGQAEKAWEIWNE